MKSKPHTCCADCSDGRDPQRMERRDPHRRLATEQAARHLASLALARWRAGNTPVELSVAATLAPRQTQWHANTQRNFCAWLMAGGFAACPPERADHPEQAENRAGATPAPPADQDALRKPAPPELSCIDGG